MNEQDKGAPSAAVPSADRLVAMLVGFATIPGRRFRDEFPEYAAAVPTVCARDDPLDFFIEYARAIWDAKASGQQP